MRKAIALVVLLVGMSGCVAYPEKKHPDWASATKSERINQLFWDDVANQRWQKLRGHVAPLAVLTEGGERVTGLDPILEKLKAEGITAAQVGEVESQPAGIDLVTTYTLSVTGKPPQKVMAVWQPAAKHWVLIGMSITVASQ